MTTPVTFSRQEFLTERWAYRAGEHVTILGPTECGKTTLGYQLLEQSATPKLQAVNMVMKPRDSTVVEWNKRIGLKVVRTWPPVSSLWSPARRNGWCLWPKHSYDFAQDNWNLYQQFYAAIKGSYRKGNRILFGDEVYGLSKELKLEEQLIGVWSRGRSMGCGLWAASQKPTHIPLWAYSQAAHLFLYFDPDQRARERFGEIGGVDPKLVERTVMRLGQHQCLYIRRKGGAMCIVDA